MNLKEKKVVVGIATAVAVAVALSANIASYKLGLKWFPFMRETDKALNNAFTLTYFLLAWGLPTFLSAGAVVWLEERLGIQE